jgi:hypothetical protein
VAEDRLSQDEVAMVLRRAAQLDGEAATPPDDLLPVAAIEAAAAEVGLAPAAVRQAVAELRAGVLGGPAGAPADPHRVVEAAVVPLDLEAASAAVGRWLAAQTFQRHRGRDGVEVWRIREDWVAGVQRKFDWSASVRLKWVREVVVRVVAVEGGTLVRLEAALATTSQQAPTIGTAAGATSGLVVGGAGIATFGGTVALGVGAVAVGAGSVGGWWVGRSARRLSRHRVADELSAELDRIGSGTKERNALDRLRDRARRSGPWLKA